MTTTESNPYASEARYHDLYPELGTGEISTEPYYSKEYFELEKEYIFKYHFEVYSKLSPFLNKKEKKWLANFI